MPSYTKALVKQFGITKDHLDETRRLSVVFNKETYTRFVAKVEESGLSKLYNIIEEMEKENSKLYNQFGIHSYMVNGRLQHAYGNRQELDAFIETTYKPDSWRCTYYYHTEKDMMKRIKSGFKCVNLQAVA